MCSLVSVNLNIDRSRRRARAARVELTLQAEAAEVCPPWRGSGRALELRITCVV